MHMCAYVCVCVETRTIQQPPANTLDRGKRDPPLSVNAANPNSTDAISAAHVRSQRMGNRYRAILVLVHLDDRYQDARARGDGVVKTMTEDGLAVLTAIAQV